jgi:hypothetical protein
MKGDLSTDTRARQAFERLTRARCTDEEWAEVKRNLIDLMIAIGIESRIVTTKPTGRRGQEEREKPISTRSRSTRMRLKDAADLLGVSVNYLQDVLQDRLKKKKHSEATHSRLLSEFFFKETNGRWYIARSVLERAMTESNLAVIHRDPERAEEIHRRLKRVL